jgi:DNA-directed RNA polymerase subunit RPC12/RpoP
VQDCKVPPFGRHYDLYRHFQTLHPSKLPEGAVEKVNCDYTKCPHKDSFRKDHCREHYREYHGEDLLKRTMPKHDKSDKDKKNTRRSQKRGESAEEFLATRRDPNFGWWRCFKCLQRVQVNTDWYMCPRCSVPCEAARVTWREEKKALSSTKNSNLGPSDSQSDFRFPSAENLETCVECKYAWFPVENDDTGEEWIRCPKCDAMVF